MTNRLAFLAPLVSSSKTKSCQFSSVQFSYVALYTPLKGLGHEVAKPTNSMHIFAEEIIWLKQKYNN